MGIYKYSYRFNAMHNTSSSVGGNHVHSFEVVFYIKQPMKTFTETEAVVNEYMSRYLGSYLNDLMDVLPTVENLGEKIFYDVNNLKTDLDIVRLEISDSPVQTYIVGEEEI